MAISFGVMFYIRYVSNIMQTVEAVSEIHEVEAKPKTLRALGIWIGLVSAILFPVFALMVLVEDRNKVIIDYARKILLKYYDVELKITS